MVNFEDYARFYDHFYRDKDYRGECDYLLQTVERFREEGSGPPRGLRILDLGCGTGRHAALLAEGGHRVVGVDRSETMLAQARARCTAGVDLRFVPGDVREVDLGETFDCVFALFHVASYQVTNRDIADFFAAAARHLEPGCPDS